MNLETLTTASQDLINSAITLAQRLHNPVLYPIHILAKTLGNEFCESFYRVLNINMVQLQQLVERTLNQLPYAPGTQLAADQTLQKFLRQCENAAQTMGDQFISIEIILLVLSQEPSLPKEIQDFFAAANFNEKTIKNHIQSIRKGRKVRGRGAEKQHQALEKYCQNLTQQARDGRLDPVIGRHEEIRRVVQILSRRTKNNPVLIGEPGVGKTAIIEGIAQRIVDNDVPEGLQDNEIFALDLGLLIAGAKFQGEFEERLKNVLKEVSESSTPIILFIDELHMLVGAGSSSGGGMDASNLLKPALARGELHCIGATTIKEYKKYIEKDAALERRFQKVLVEEPSIEDAISILRGLKERYELHHGIRITDQALVDAVNLSAKNIPDRFLPDKAIDLIDEAAAMVKIAIDSQPETIDKLDRKIRQLEIEKVALQKEKDEPSKKRLKELEKELSELREEHQKLLNKWKAERAPLEKINTIKEDIEKAQNRYQQAERAGDFAKASEIKYGTLAKLEKDLEKEKKKIKDLKTDLIKEEVNERDIASILSRWTGIPAAKLQESETKKLLAMSKTLKERVIGQGQAIDEITHAIQMHRTGLTDPNKPIGSFLFLGPTGVGKTEVAKTLADYLFNDSDRMVRIDMSEYMEKHAVARLIGSPPGYVGYEEGGQLTEAVRRHPFSVVLFDEIEKAHPDVFNIFLQILDDGRLTDAQGRTVSFKNTIIIMTSNIGSDIILKAKKIDDKVKEEIDTRLHKTFRPEFLNRIDSIIYFNTLTHEDVVKIAQLQINILRKRLEEKDITLSVTPKALDLVAKKGYQKEFGARPLNRAIKRYITIPLSQFMLQHPKQKDITVGASKDEFTIK